MKAAERLRIAEQIVSFLRALNRPPKKIRTSRGWTTTHDILRTRARLELGITFADLPSGGVEWRTYDKNLRSIGRKLIAICEYCGAAFVKRSRKSRACRDASCKKLAMRDLLRSWREKNPERLRQQVKAWREKNPDKYRAQMNAWREKNREHDRALSRKSYAKNRERILEQKRVSRRLRRLATSAD